jgi:hypothetical protein
VHSLNGFVRSLILVGALGTFGCASAPEEIEDGSTHSLTGAPAVIAPTDVRFRGSCSARPEVPLRATVSFDLDPGVRPPHWPSESRWFELGFFVDGTSSVEVRIGQGPDYPTSIRFLRKRPWTPEGMARFEEVVRPTTALGDTLHVESERLVPGVTFECNATLVRLTRLTAD